MDALVFMTDSISDFKNEETSNTDKNLSSVEGNKDLSFTQLEAQEEQKLAAQKPDTDLSTSVQRSVDLYKAIFSDDSDDEDNLGFNSVVEPERRSSGANRTLNRIIAGDFLDSLGKELGLEVHTAPLHVDKANFTCLTSPNNSKPTPAIETLNSAMNEKEIKIDESKMPETIGNSVCPRKSYKSNESESVYTEEGRPNDSGSLTENMIISSRTGADNSFCGHEENRSDKKEQNRRHRRRSRRQLISSDSDSSNGRGYHERSRSEKKASLKRKHTRQARHHHKHKSSGTRSRYSDDESDSELLDVGIRDRKSRDGRGHAGRSKFDGGRKYR